MYLFFDSKLNTNSNGTISDVLYSLTDMIHSPSFVTCTLLIEFNMYPCLAYHSRMYFENNCMDDTGSDDPTMLERVLA